MTEREIKRIQRKFIFVSTVAFFLVMFMMGGFIYLFSNITLNNEIKILMKIIADNDGELPKISFIQEETSDKEDVDKTSDEEVESYQSLSFEERMEWNLESIFGIGDMYGESADYLYSTRFFSVIFDDKDQVEDVKMTHIAHVNEEQVIKYAKRALDDWRDYGNFGRYYFYVQERDDGSSIVIYLDRTAQIASMNRILFSAMSLIGFGTVLAFFIMRLISKSIVKTEVKNAEKQKQFITNASHELKTPLAVIRANTEMSEIESGESEWTRSTMRQVDRMDGLIKNLVSIARAEEHNDGKFTLMDIVPVIRDTAEAMKTVAVSEGKSFDINTPDELYHSCDESKLRQMVSLLTDNAVKYCDEKGRIEVSLTKAGRGKKVILTVSNDYSNGANVDYSRFFERFYREDEAHTKGGYGIGLSVISGLINELKGTIDVGWSDGRISFKCRF
ncbi:MAG: HAMP domain-containing histidine kinase [Lachnospiraceae bacterium]|nr:HAMP domain-containing histidine kinase [Lachnospiraceae bacterium]